MRRQTLLIATILAALPCMPVVLGAQDSTPPSSGARQETEEYFKAVNSRLEELAAENESLRKQIDNLKQEIRKLSEEVSRANDRSSKDTSTAESLKLLKKAIEEVDSKRMEDHKLVLAEFERLGKLLKEPITMKNPPGNTSGKSPVTPKGWDTPPKTEGGSYYAIRENDSLSKIVSALRKQNIKITIEQVKEANPKVNWNRLQIGQQIFLPGVIPP